MEREREVSSPSLSTSTKLPTIARIREHKFKTPIKGKQSPHKFVGCPKLENTSYFGETLDWNWPNLLNAEDPYVSTLLTTSGDTFVWLEKPGVHGSDP